MNFFYIIPLYLAGLSFVGCPPAGKAFDPQEAPEETEAEIADLKEEIHELKEEVEEIKDDVEVLQLKDDVRDIRDDVAEMKEDMQDLKEEKDDTKHEHVNPYKFFNKIQKDTEEARKERIEEKVDKINPLKMRKIVKFCGGSEEIAEKAQELCSELMNLLMSLSDVIEKRGSDDQNDSVQDENEISRKEHRRSKRSAWFFHFLFPDSYIHICITVKDYIWVKYINKKSILTEVFFYSEFTSGIAEIWRNIRSRVTTRAPREVWAARGLL